MDDECVLVKESGMFASDTRMFMYDERMLMLTCRKLQVTDTMSGSDHTDVYQDREASVVFLMYFHIQLRHRCKG